MAILARFLLALLTVLNAVTFAHPGHNHKREAAERAAYLRTARSLSHCTEKLRARGVEQRNIARREALAKSIRAKRGLSANPFLKVRDFDSVLNTTHHSNLTGITLDTPESQIFSDNSSCVLQPDVTEGPYYVAGEYIRKNVTSGQAGVPLTFDIQVVDSTTCDVLSGIYMDFWSANSTGVYGGVTASGNGNSNDTTNLNNTAFRGIQQTDSYGIAEFETVMPGHYTGRTNHIHVVTHTTNTTVNTNNNTLNALSATHVGQIFFDQSLLDSVEQLAPYSTNTQPITTNAEDIFFQQEANSSDPMMEYVLLGENVEDGLLGWITIGINTTETREVVPAAFFGSAGGVNYGDGIGGGFASGSVPSGLPSALPTGSVGSSVVAASATTAA